jgi:hypothetical protein
VNSVRRIRLGEENDLTGVHREVLDHVIDGFEHRSASFLYRAGPDKIVDSESGHNGIGCGHSLREILDKGGARGPVTGGEFCRAIALHIPSTHPADYPLPHVSGQVQKEIPDAVRGLVGSPPDCIFRQGGYALPQLGKVFSR